MHYVMSDIHGDMNAFAKIMSMIDLQRNDRLYILGDVIDRGEYGIELLQTIRDIPNCTLLMGNHEYMMINALRNPDKKRLMRIWENNGCDHTYASFKVLSEEQQEEMLVYLESLPIQIEITVDGDTYILVHAAPKELFEAENWKYKTKKEFSLWHRITKYAVMPEGKTVIFGHTPTKMLYYSYDKRMHIFRDTGCIAIDCGCSYYGFGGQLGCLRIEDMTAFYSLDGIMKVQDISDEV